MKDQNHTTKCNWCGKDVVMALAKYFSNIGRFYHRDCWDEKQEEGKPSDK
jgi:hypothetical protein